MLRVSDHVQVKVKRTSPVFIEPTLSIGLSATSANAKTTRLRECYKLYERTQSQTQGPCDNTSRMRSSAPRSSPILHLCSMMLRAHTPGKCVVVVSPPKHGFRATQKQDQRSTTRSSSLQPSKLACLTISAETLTHDHCNDNR